MAKQIIGTVSSNKGTLDDLRMAGESGSMPLLSRLGINRKSQKITRFLVDLSSSSRPVA